MVYRHHYCSLGQLYSTLLDLLLGNTAETQDFSTPPRPIHLSDVSCSGEETSIFQCSSSTGSSLTCPDNNAGVTCRGMLMNVHLA